MKIIFYVIFLFTFCNASSQNLSLGLRAYYPFSGNANDISGFNNNPSSNNATLTTDRLGNANSAYHFNGTSNFMQIPSSASLNPGTAISVCAWVRPTGFYMGTCHGNSILIKGDAANPSFLDSYLLRFDDGMYTNYGNCANATVDVVHQNFYGPYPSAVTAYTPYIQTGVWTSLVYTYDGANIKLYVDCVLKKIISYSSYNFTNTFDLFFGKLNNVLYPYWYNGDLDEVRIYNRALIQSEVDLYGACAVAPVKVSKFEATTVNNKSIQLFWTAEEESDIVNYTVERSTNGIDFTNLDAVSATNVAGSHSYSYVDISALSNVQYFYRLRIIDKVGKTEFTPVKSAQIKRVDLFAFIYPNPANDVVKLFLQNSKGMVDIAVSNVLGEVIIRKSAFTTGSFSTELDISVLSRGTYFITFTNGGKIVTEKLVKQ